MGNGDLELGRFQYYRLVYDNLFAEVSEVIKQAITIGSSIKKTNNCKLIVDTLSQYKFEDIRPKIKDRLVEMTAFFQTSFKGFYCTICDVANHPFIDVTRRNVKLSKPFCWNLLQNTVKPLIYLHTHFKQIVNLATRFVTNCDEQGNYVSSLLEESKYRLVMKPKTKLILRRCLKSMTGQLPEWLEYCQPICRKFSLVRLRKFFFPQVNKLARLT